MIARPGRAPDSNDDWAAMNDAAPTGTSARQPATVWADLVRDGRALSSLLVVLGAALHALNILVIAIIMPTVVGDLGGAAFYAWPAMVYTIGSIVGSASLGPVWTALGARRGYAASGVLLLAGTVWCAVAGDMASLVVARGVQGFGGGLVVAGVMALISTLFSEALRPRVLAMFQGVWMVSQLLGPLVGGVFAEIGWWRGSFWAMVPVVLGFTVLVWFRLPPAAEGGGAGQRTAFPVARLSLLAAGVFGIAAAGPVQDAVLRVAVFAAGAGMVWYALRLDRVAGNRLYPARALSLDTTVGCALWILFVVGLVQTSVTLFLPLLLQVVHGVTPLFISFVTIVVSAGWTVGTFTVSGWTGARERFALWVGPLLMIAGLVGITVTAVSPALVLVTLSAFVLGLGIGTHNVHLIARAMTAADPGEDRVTAAALPSFRSLGTAVGAAAAGMLSTIAGLDDSMAPDAVGRAITLVYGFGLLPLIFAAVFMFRMVRIGPVEKVRPSAG